MINIKKSLFSIVAIVFLFQIIKYYSFYVEYSDWQYADWIINYQGGFIRRGYESSLRSQMSSRKCTTETIVKP